MWSLLNVRDPIGLITQKHAAKQLSNMELNQGSIDLYLYLFFSPGRSKIKMVSKIQLIVARHCVEVRNSLRVRLFICIYILLLDVFIGSKAKKWNP